MKKLGQISGIFLILMQLFYFLNNVGGLDIVLPMGVYAIFNLGYVSLGVFIFLLSSKLK